VHIPVSRGPNGAIIIKQGFDWLVARCVVYIVRSAIRQYVHDFNLAISVNSPFVTRDSLRIDCFCRMTYCGVRIRGVANCYKIVPSPPSGEF